MVGEGGRQKDGHCDFIFFCTLGLAKKTGKHILHLSPFSLLHRKKFKEQNSETLMSFFFFLVETLQLGALELLILYLSTCAKIPTLAGCENLIDSWQNHSLNFILVLEPLVGKTTFNSQFLGDPICAALGKFLNLLWAPLPPRLMQCEIKK